MKKLFKNAWFVYYNWYLKNIYWWIINIGLIFILLNVSPLSAREGVYIEKCFTVEKRHVAYSKKQVLYYLQIIPLIDVKIKYDSYKDFYVINYIDRKCESHCVSRCG